MRGLVRARPAGLQRPLRDPGTVRHLPGRTAQSLRRPSPDPIRDTTPGRRRTSAGGGRLASARRLRPGCRGGRAARRAAPLLPATPVRVPDPRRRAPASAAPARPGTHRQPGRRRPGESSMNLQAPWSTARFAVVDVEGNGQQPPDLVEIAIVPIIGGEIGEPRTWLVRPPRPITAMARRFHQITDEEIADAPPIADVADQITAELDGAVFAAHNAHIDLSVVTRELPGYHPALGVADTLKLSRRLIGGLDSYKLGALGNTLALADGLPEALRPHRAEYDALVA